MEMEDVKRIPLKLSSAMYFLEMFIISIDIDTAFWRLQTDNTMENMKNGDTEIKEYFLISPGKSCLVHEIGQWKRVLAVAA